MDDAGPAWDLYRSFLAVMDTGSLSGAARALAIAQPTVGRHVEALEQDPGGDPSSPARPAACGPPKRPSP